MELLWNWITTTFNSREIATGFWLGLFLVLLLAYRKTRKALGPLFRAIFAYKIVILFGSFALYLALWVWFLSQFGIWTRGLIPATILWFILSGVFQLSRGLDAKEDERYFSNLIWNNIRVITVVEFIVVAKTFSLTFEMLLVPFLGFLSLLLAMAETKREYASAKKMVETILIVIVGVLIWQSLRGIWQSPKLFFTADNGRAFLLPIILTLVSAPFQYVWYCYSHIEGARIQINMKSFQSNELKAYARKRFFRVFAARPWLLRRATRQFHNLPARKKLDIDQIIDDIYKHERRAENPPEISPSKGWSPYLARDFLTEHGMRTDDYHRAHLEDEWWASAPFIKLDDGILPNQATFYLEGLSECVTTLKLTGKFLDEYATTEALEKLYEISVSLIQVALSIEATEAQSLLPQDLTSGFSGNLGSTKVTVENRRYPNDNGYEIFILLVRHG